MTNTTPNGAKHATAAPTGEAQVDPSATPPPALWRDVSTVPRDHTEILAFWAGGHFCVGRVVDQAFLPSGWPWGERLWTMPTHWAPLPTPPGAVA